MRVLQCMVIVLAGVVAGCSGASSESSASAPPSWRVAAAPGFVEDALATADGVLVVGSTGEPGASDARPGIWSSPDGSDWAAAQVVGEGRVASVAAGASGYVAVGQRAASSSIRGQAWQSADGSSWQPAGDSAFQPVTGCASTELDAVASGAGGYVAVGVEWGDGACGQHAAAWFSSDGTTWTRASIDNAGNAMRQVSAIDGAFVAGGATNAAAGEGTHAMFWFSADGRTWSADPDIAGFAGGEPAALAPLGAGGLLAVGMHVVQGTPAGLQPAAWRSRDGRTWELLRAPGLVWAEATSSPPPSGGALSAMALTSELVVTERGAIALGAGMSMQVAQDGSTSAPSPWRFLVWTSPTATDWVAAPADDALEVGTTASYVLGPAAGVVIGGRLVLFGTRFEDAREGQPPLRNPTIWSTDLGSLLASTGA